MIQNELKLILTSCSLLHFSCLEKKIQIKILHLWAYPLSWNIHSFALENSRWNQPGFPGMEWAALQGLAQSISGKGQQIATEETNMNLQ